MHGARHDARVQQVCAYSDAAAAEFGMPPHVTIPRTPLAIRVGTTEVDTARVSQTLQRGVVS